MRYLGVDPGDARIGLSVSDDQGLIARPLDILKHTSRVENARKICEIADKEVCNAIVVGVPYDSDGGVGPRARASLKLIEALRFKSNLSVFPWDESGTSQAVNELLIQVSVSKKNRKKPKDDVAAMLILNDFLKFQQQVNDTERHS